METFWEEGLYFGKGEIILYFVVVSSDNHEEEVIYKE
jgi:hypothetical protein